VYETVYNTVLLGPILLHANDIGDKFAKLQDKSLAYSAKYIIYHS